MLKNFFNSLCFCNGENNELLNKNINLQMITKTDKSINNKKDIKSSNKILNNCEYNFVNNDKNISTEITNESKNVLKNQELKAKLKKISNNKKEEQTHKLNYPEKNSEDKKNELQSKNILNSKKEKKDFENLQNSINDIIYRNLDENSESADDSSD